MEAAALEVQMRQTFKLGRIAGTAVGVHWSVLVTLFLVALSLTTSMSADADTSVPEGVYWAAGLLAALVFLGSLLAHEIAHTLVAHHYGVPVRNITLWGLGGVSEMTREPPSPRADLAIAAAGPLASLALALIFGAAFLGADVVGAPQAVTRMMAWLMLMNAVLAAFNLLPGAPLDGGRVLRALLWSRHGDRDRADRAAAGAGRIVGLGIVAAGLFQVLFLGSVGGIWLILIGWFINWAATNERLAVTLRAAVGTRRVREIMTPGPVCAPAWQTVRHFVAEAVMTTRQSVFPVTGLAGVPTGLVTVDLLARTPPGQADRPVSSIALPLPADHVDGPEDPALPLLSRAPEAGQLLSVVVADGRVVGMVTTEDIRQLLSRERLRSYAADEHPAGV